MEQENTYGLAIIEIMGTERLVNFPNSTRLNIVSIVILSDNYFQSYQKLMGRTYVKNTEKSSMFQVEQDTYILSKNFSQKMS